MSQKRIQILLLFLSLALSIHTLPAQTTCHATAPARVESGRNFEYQITLNEKPSEMRSPDFPGFTVVGGPNQGVRSSTTFVNGDFQQSTTYTYSYVLRADKAGTFTIPGALFKVNGKEIRANNVTLTVVAGSPSSQQRPSTQRGTSPPPSLQEEDVYLKAFVSKSNPYEGEQVTITYKLYILSNYDGEFRATNTTLPSQNGLWTYQLGDPNEELRGVTENVGGRMFKVYELKRVAAFPQKSGGITISPMETELTLRIYYRQAFGFPWPQDYRLSLKSNSINLNVKSLPLQGRPDDFSGLVGDFQIKSNLSRSELQANDATNLTLTVSGTGNIQHIAAPAMNFPPDCDVADPKLSDNINTKGTIVSGLRHIEYVIIPRTAGTFKIPAARFSYFDPSSGTYKTASAMEYTLRVEKGEGENASSTSFANQKDIQYLDQDIRYIKSGKNAFAPPKGYFLFSPWYFLSGLIPLLLFVAILSLWKKYHDDRKDLLSLKDKRAGKEAQKRLRKARALLKEGDKEAFFNEISKALWGYLGDKYRIPRARLSLEVVVETLRGKRLPEEYIQAAVATLEQCEFARFAPGDTSEQMRGMYDQALLFMSKIGKNKNRMKGSRV